MKKRTFIGKSTNNDPYSNKFFNFDQDSFGPSLSPEFNSWYKKRIQTSLFDKLKLIKKRGG